jgi:hypothetical protein
LVSLDVVLINTPAVNPISASAFSVMAKVGPVPARRFDGSAHTCRHVRQHTTDLIIRKSRPRTANTALDVGRALGRRTPKQASEGAAHQRQARAIVVVGQSVDAQVGDFSVRPLGDSARVGGSREYGTQTLK